MSNIPIIKIGKNLIVSIQMDLDDTAAINLQQYLLESIRKYNATGVLIELSALDMVDSFLGRILSDISISSSTLNARTVLVGIQPAVAITLVELGLTLPGISTALNVEEGIKTLEEHENIENIDFDP